MNGILPEKTRWRLLQCFLHCLPLCPHLHLPLEPPLHHPALLSGPMLPWRCRVTGHTSNPTATSSTKKHAKKSMTKRKHLNKKMHHQNVSIFISYSSLGWYILSYDMMTPILIDTSAIRRRYCFNILLNVWLNTDSCSEQQRADVMPAEEIQVKFNLHKNLNAIFYIWSQLPPPLRCFGFLKTDRQFHFLNNIIYSVPPPPWRSS